MVRASKQGYLVDSTQYSNADKNEMRTTQKQVTATANLSRMHLLELPFKGDFSELGREHPRASVVAREMERFLDKLQEVNTEYAHARIVLHCMLWLLNKRKSSYASHHWGRVVSAQNDLKLLGVERDIHRGRKQIEGASRGGKQRAINKRQEHKAILRKADNLSHLTKDKQAEAIAKDPDITQTAPTIRNILKTPKRGIRRKGKPR